jgi:hypothetical protein
VSAYDDDDDDDRRRRHHHHHFAERNMSIWYIVVISEKVARHITPIAVVSPLLWKCSLLICGPRAGNLFHFVHVSVNKWRQLWLRLIMQWPNRLCVPLRSLLHLYAVLRNCVTVVTTTCLAFNVFVKNRSITANRILRLADWLAEFLHCVRPVVLSH